ncbi:hypothetical protein BKP45_05175 [Anaerobacillus alkalidiazotrophicus]|uniref:Phosphatidylglycerol lysyltransferase n=2 Tax=Anaerobacillus alkalidiazotrophicus TaxID=472963 RepID=A0A1S2MBC6_9BACI|nr:hypothetical protein BKP45_05175 [Anaerobacillus alkalidiazotrophicus]
MHLETFEDALKQLVGKKGTSWVGQLLLALIIWISFPFKAFLISISLQMDVNFLTISAITFLAYMVAMIPITPGGLGTFEGSTVLLLSSLQIAVTEAVIFAILLRFITFWFVFLISFLYSGGLYMNKNHRVTYFGFLIKKETVEKSA